MTDRPPAPAALALTLFGGFQARLASGAPVRLAMKKAQALLAYLALSGGRPRPRGALAALLWGVATDRAARNSLRQTLFALRRALPETAAGALTIETGSVTLDPAAVESDVVEFEREIAAGTPPARERAVALYRGALLEGFDLRAPAFDAWLGAERERLRGLVGQALGHLLAHHAAAGTLGRAVECAQRGLALDPLDEALHRTLMELHARDGRQAAALRQYQICLEVLARELGVEPEPATRELYQRLLQRRGSPVEAPLAHAAAPGIDTPIVGRAAEITRLREALDRAWAGLGAVVALVGEAGIGKTRLARELAAEAERRGGRVLVGACHEAERILPFRPWIDALRTGGVTEPDPPAADSPQRFFEALVRLLLGLAARQPLVLVLEDLHWADEMSVRFLSFLVHRLPAAVLVALTIRDEDLADAPLLRQLLAQLDREQSLTRIALPPLGRSDTQSLVHALARAGTASTAVSRLARQVWAASEGNPFVVVEMMRAVEQGTSAPAAGAPGRPEKVQELIAGRLDRLGAPAQQLASVAAVIGHAFDWALVERAAGLGERATAEGVEELVRRRVLQPDG
ncbi:MAG: AAA family ATPase, partial [Candidatus Rokubacteria bacterium]|nr:AAA family ATPase [Candidatus Rokubacteria bacterium]